MGDAVRCGSQAVPDDSLAAQDGSVAQDDSPAAQADIREMPAGSPEHPVAVHLRSVARVELHLPGRRGAGRCDFRALPVFRAELLVRQDVARRRGSLEPAGRAHWLDHRAHHAAKAVPE
jgi:hypothetical protein